MINNHKQELRKRPTYDEMLKQAITSKMKTTVILKKYKKYMLLKEAFKVMGEPVEIFSDDDGAFKAEVKKYLDDLGIIHKTTLTHANIVEKLIRTMKKGIGDRIHFTKGRWTDMLKPTKKILALFTQQLE